ncbi:MULTISPECIES: hypothetical protein [Rhodococcus]|uniref:Uncharacterized protein n=1 Tax=Rhodococcus qingshengii TaxID=334542 RepID=A0AAW6LW78_RHOSG|nr:MULTISPECIES: hypothetical protein [Rhodococcus]MBQ9055265.1 hypothetical protein [Rhodococcus sp. (in: high G+C Gram-positive bacteria)]MDE8649630.1 hypothetical protein [Rhodococcus qingshengii]QXC46416.1 hypothetical protein KSE96_29540 [Rhodococcus qingshengii]
MNGDVDPSGLTCGNQAGRVSRLGDVSIVHRLFEEGVGESGFPFDARGDGLGICTRRNFFGGLSEYLGIGYRAFSPETLDPAAVSGHVERGRVTTGSGIQKRP